MNVKPVIAEKVDWFKTDRWTSWPCSACVADVVAKVWEKRPDLMESWCGDADDIGVRVGVKMHSPVVAIEGLSYDAPTDSQEFEPIYGVWLCRKHARQLMVRLRSILREKRHA